MFILFSLDLKDANRTEGGVTEDCSEESETTSVTDTDDERQSEEFLSHKPPNETEYYENELDVVSSKGGPLQEEFAEENKNIIWCLMKQVCVDGRL